MRNNNFAVSMNPDGELLQEDLHRFTKDKYKPDSPFLMGVVSYSIMILCIVIDIAFFRALFVRISYDEPLMIILEVAGLVFAADVVAAYAGILAKKLYQGLSRERFNLYLLLAVPILALIVNGVLRISTMSLSSVDGNIDPASIALTIIAIVTPIFTSVGNFAISFQNYNPLKKKMYKEELAIDEVRDYCRRLEAIKEECEDFSEERMKEMDKKHLENAKKELINDAFRLYADVRIKLIEYLENPTSTNVLSKSRCNEIFSRINQELEVINAISMKDSLVNKSEGKDIINLTEVAQGGVKNEKYII